MPMKNKRAKQPKIAIFEQFFWFWAQDGGNIFLGITQRQEIVGTIDNTETEEKVYEPRQKKKKVTEKTGC